MEGALSLGKVRHGNHHNPQGDEYPRGRAVLRSTNLRPLCFPFIRARLKSQARVCGNAIYITSAACVQKDRDESASFISALRSLAFGPRRVLAFVSPQLRPAAPFLNASYSAVPGLGGTPYRHSAQPLRGAWSPTMPPEVLETRDRERCWR